MPLSPGALGAVCPKTNEGASHAGHAQAGAAEVDCAIRNGYSARKAKQKHYPRDAIHRGIYWRGFFGRRFTVMFRRGFAPGALRPRGFFFAPRARRRCVNPVPSIRHWCGGDASILPAISPPPRPGQGRSPHHHITAPAASPHHPAPDPTKRATRPQNLSPYTYPLPHPQNPLKTRFAGAARQSLPAPTRSQPTPARNQGRGVCLLRDRPQRVRGETQFRPRQSHRPPPADVFLELEPKQNSKQKKFFL